MTPEDSASEDAEGDDNAPDTEWRSSLRELADRIRAEKRTERTAESTPASDWAPNITAEERSDADTATDGAAEFELGYTPSVDNAAGERQATADSGTDNAQDGEPKRDESTDPEIDIVQTDTQTHTDLSVTQSGAKHSSADGSGSAVETLGDVKTTANSDPPDGDETVETPTDADGQDPATDSADHSVAADETDMESEISPEDTNFGDAFRTDSDPDSSALGNRSADTDTQHTDSAEPSLGEIGLSDAGDATTGSDSDPHATGTSEQAATETPTQSGIGGFGELADRMAASREKNASSKKQKNTDSSETDAGASEDTPSQSGEGSRQLPLGANEPEFSTDLSPLVKPNMSAMLLGALKSAPVDQACGKLLRFPDGRDYNLLLVTVTQSAEDRLLTVYENSEGLPENIGVVAIDNNVSAQNTTQTIPVGGVDRTVQMKTATDPGDIKGIGIRISKQLSEWDDNDRPAMVCFHSLTSILQYISTKQLFQFIHLLQNRLRSYDAVVHYHIDPSVHDKMTLSQIKPLLDHVIEVENDGTCWIE